MPSAKKTATVKQEEIDTETTKDNKEDATSSNQAMTQARVETDNNGNLKDAAPESSDRVTLDQKNDVTRVSDTGGDDSSDQVTQSSLAKESTNGFTEGATYSGGDDKITSEPDSNSSTVDLGCGNQTNEMTAKEVIGKEGIIHRQTHFEIENGRYQPVDPKHVALVLNNVDVEELPAGWKRVYDTQRKIRVWLYISPDGTTVKKCENTPKVSY